MKKFATAALVALVGAAPILATVTDAAADSRKYRNGKPVYSHRYSNNGGNNLQGVGAGLVAGAALGLGAGLLINRPPPPPVYYAPPPPPPVVYYPAPAYYPPPPPPPVYYDSGWTEAHIEWCLDRYRSYNPATNTFTGYDGYQHECRGPY
ncbi:MAG TPA: BA14K family protein [Bauldia sp.]|nr:BA14K family protein [Bauldia sp.]